MDQDGLPALLAIYRLSKDKEIVSVSPGLELLRGENPVAEFDFVFISDQLVYAGETKAGTAVVERDLERAEFAESLGINKFYFCTSKGFSDESLPKIQALRKTIDPKPMEIFTLGKKELFDNKSE
jgi:hypothetical protein